MIEGHKVKAVVVFKGREITYREFGEDIINRLTEKISDVSKIDQSLHMEGRNMIVVYTPEKAKKKIENKTIKVEKIDKPKEGNKENAQDEE